MNISSENIELIISYIISGYISWLIVSKYIPSSNDKESPFKQFLDFVVYGAINTYLLEVLNKRFCIAKDFFFPLLIVVSIFIGFFISKFLGLIQKGVLFESWNKTISTAWNNVFIYSENRNKTTWFARITLKSQKVVWGCFSAADDELKSLGYVSDSYAENADLFIRLFSYEENRDIPVQEEKAFLWILKEEIDHMELYKDLPLEKWKKDQEIDKEIRHGRTTKRSNRKCIYRYTSRCH